jgi:hypothetical protein
MVFRFLRDCGTAHGKTFNPKSAKLFYQPAGAPVNQQRKHQTAFLRLLFPAVVNPPTNCRTRTTFQLDYLALSTLQR